MYDFQRVNSLLVAKSGRLKLAEARMIELAAKWMGVGDIDTERLLTYPESFDIRGLTDEFGVATNLQLLGAPDSARRYQMELLLDKVFPNLTKERKAEIDSDLKNYPPQPVEPAPAGGAKKSEPTTSATKEESDKKAENDKVRKKD